MPDKIETWLDAACADAERRGLPELRPLLQTLARSTKALRAADERQRLRAEPDTPHDSDRR
jgi:hypothetical protein